MEILKHLELYDMRRWTTLEGITCRDCAYYSHKGCGNAVAVLDEMRSRGNDMSMPIFDFTPDPDLRADQCPGMWPSEDYLAEIGATMRDHARAARGPAREQGAGGPAGQVRRRHGADRGGRREGGGMRPYMTEDEAKLKGCPMRMAGASVPIREDVRRQTARIVCVASHCMWWGWEVEDGCRNTVMGRCEAPGGAQ